MTAYAYLRRSSVSAASPGEASREAQEAAVRALAARHGDDPVLLVDWGISGRKGRDKRPGYAALLDAIESGACTAVYSYSLTRLGRSVPELSRLISDCDERGIPVRLAADSLDTSTASGRMLAFVLAAVAQFESDVTSERVRAAQAARLARGERLGPAFYPHVDAVLAAYDEAGTWAGAARILNERGPAPQKARYWHPSSVMGIVRRHRPYIPNPGRGRRTTGAFAFSRLLRCPTCATFLTGSTDHGGNLIRYQCRRGSIIPHPRVSITEGKLLGWAKDEAARLTTPERVEAEEGAERRLRAIEARRERLVDAYVSGTVERADYLRRVHDLDEEAAGVERERRILDVPALDWDWGPREINSVLRSLWRFVDLDEDFRPLRAHWTAPHWRDDAPRPLTSAKRGSDATLGPRTG